MSESRFRIKEYTDEALFRDTTIGPIGADLREFHGDDISTLIAEKKDYAYLYHLSELRANVIRQYPFSGQEKVLEIGCCPGITALLAEETAAVTVLDEHAILRVIDSIRNERFRNITYVDKSMEEYLDRSEDTFDLITCIASFETIPLYYRTEEEPMKAYQTFLKTLRKHLRPGGVFLAAVPNRLGLKYFAGVKEEHSASYYHGIEGFEPDERVRTFTRKEWTELLDDAGFRHVTFAYPYPDHLFAMQIFTDQRLPEIEDADNDYKNFSQMRMATFDEAKVMQTLTENGLFPQFSNSFLITAE
ncbi:MAG: methyltransferase domain-containing protein [Eubacteriales bacterium]|nr:methyltransferase domain-containing protein [Eubacteriales bacterium]